MIASRSLFQKVLNSCKSVPMWLSQVVHRVRDGIAISNAGYEALVADIEAAGAGVTSLSNSELRARFDSLRQWSTAKSQSRALLVEALTIVREAALRTLSMRPFDVQMLAAVAMLESKCVEMQTGEGKTLAAAVTNCLTASRGHGVHVLTFNDYLAQRDAKWMAPLYSFLGLTVGHVAQGMPSAERRAAYLCDITYLTAREAAFDFLRDQLCQVMEDRVQRGFHVALIDEADSILIDEARIPMVIATEADLDSTDLYQIAKLVRQLQKGKHYEIKVSGRNVALTDSGIRWIERQLGIEELHSEEHMHLLARINLALQADALLTLNIDYIVRGTVIELIDEFTGRVAENRKWPGGLQAALEAKEGLEIRPQGKILNTITLQQFVAQYTRLAGMTGTASEAAEELGDFYRLKVVIVPTNRPCVRIDHPDRIFGTKSQKLEALLQEIQCHHLTGRPILIGTASVDETQVLERALVDASVPCRILNATNDHLEAEVIAEAGALGAVTISTNMSGRGTDICLGGTQHDTARRVVELGGLYVIGTNRHESRRIDNQLRGRSGRQGDPGASRFFISLEDDLIAQHGIADLVQTGHASSSIDNPETTKRIAQVQRIIEGECCEIRRTLRLYSQLLEIQRKAVSADRENLVRGIQSSIILNNLDPGLYRRLSEKWGETLVAEAERSVTLLHLDWCWSDHLAHAAEIRENIHLASFGGFNPQDLFNRQMNLAFREFRSAVEEKTISTLRSATFTSAGIDLEKAGLRTPSSTWTFMINDNPRGAVLNILIRGVFGRLKKLLGT